ncbi:MAG TPA: hypothetical protein VJ740_08410 [Hyphomicrobiaceae bacterium]|nr:hypothetical protein [Hyphomicrobiaceae bacterium]
MASKATSKGRMFAAAGLVVAVTAGAGVLRSDLLLNRGFGQALEASRPALSFDTSTADSRPQGATVGDEGFWLTRAEVESPTPFAKPLAVGDRITISGREGRERQLEVVDLRTVGGNARGAGGTALRLLLVTCRVSGDGADQANAPVRFIVEAEPSAPVRPAPAKAL